MLLAHPSLEERATNPFHHILVPTDFDASANRASDLAVDLAKQFGARLTLLHVWQVPTYVYNEGISWPVEDLEREATKTMAGLVEALKVRYPNVEGVVTSGLPHQQIIAVATARGVDLIVMGTHGRRGFSHVLLGSVAERVVRLSPVPVLTVSAREK